MFTMNSKETNFFDLFVEAAKKTGKSAEMLHNLITEYNDVEKKINAIEEIEHECDAQVHKILKQLNKAFITPIDREDIYLIAKELDNITDAVEATAHRFRMYNVKTVNSEAKELSKLIVDCTRELENVMVELKSMGKSKTLNEKVIEVNRIEDKGDTIFRDAVTKLFETEKDAVEVLKWKEIYEYLENTLDACEDVANIIEGVVMKHS